MMNRCLVISLTALVIGCTAPEPLTGVDVEDAAFVALSQYFRDTGRTASETPTCVYYVELPAGEGPLQQRTFSRRANDVAALVGQIAAPSVCSQKPSFQKQHLFCQQTHSDAPETIRMRCGTVAGPLIGGGHIYEIRKRAGMLQAQQVGIWAT